MMKMIPIAAKLWIPACFFLVSLSSYAQTAIQFREGEWTKLNSCSKCAECLDGASDKLEQAKGIEFFCGEKTLGKWFVIKIELKDCGYTYYRTLNSNDYNVGQSSFRLLADALADIYREVREYCPGVGEIRRMESPASEFSLPIIQNFFLEHPFFREPETEPYFYFIADMPRFPGCESQGTDLEKQRCSTQNLNRALAENITYPAAARRKGIEGAVVVEFIIDQSGNMGSPKITQSLGEEIDQVVLRAVIILQEKGIKWKPGMVKGQAVETLYRTEVEFSLD